MEQPIRSDDVQVFHFHKYTVVKLYISIIRWTHASNTRKGSGKGYSNLAAQLRVTETDTHIKNNARYMKHKKLETDSTQGLKKRKGNMGNMNI